LVGSRMGSLLIVQAPVFHSFLRCAGWVPVGSCGSRNRDGHDPRL